MYAAKAHASALAVALSLFLKELLEKPPVNLNDWLVLVVAAVVTWVVVYFAPYAPAPARRRRN